MSDRNPSIPPREDLAMILDGIADGVVAMDADGRVLFANDSAARMLGFRAAQEILEAGHSSALTTHLDLFDEQMKPIDPSLLPTGRALRGDTTAEMLVGSRRRAGGPIRWVMSKARPVYDPAGALRSVVTIFRDVTAARAAEDALRGASDAFQAVVRSSPLPIVVLESDRKVVLWNPAAERVFGWTEDEVVGRSAPMIPSDRTQELEAYIDRQRRGINVPPLETQRLTARGELLDVTVWGTSFLSPEGRPQMLGILADATDARRAVAERERLLRQIETERNFLQVILEQLPIGARVANAQGEIIFANQQLRKIWRAEDDANWIGFHPDGTPYAANEWPIFRAAAGRERIINEEIEIIRADQTRGTLIVSSAPVRDEEGALVGGVAVLSDITERKRDERGSRFLAEASRLFTSSLDHRVTLQKVARLAVPWLADWCAVHIVRRDGTIGTVTIEHTDPDRTARAKTIVPEYRPDPSSARGVANVIRTGRSETYLDITDELLTAAAEDDRTLELFRTIAPRNALIVPIVGRQRNLGAMTFVSSDPARGFDEKDRELAEELARRAGLAVENAILFRRESDARKEAEQAARRTATLQHFAEALSEAATEESIADLIVRTGLKELGADAGSLALVRAEEVAITRSEGYRDEVEQRWKTFPLTAPLPIADAIRERRIVTYSSLEELFEKYPQLRTIEGWTHRSFAAVPLLVESRAIGAIGLSFLEVRAFDREEIDLMLAVSRQCAQAVERSRLLEAERTARAEAEAANRAKDEFLATLSHELRTPMTATLGWARMLTMLNVDEETLRLAIDSIFRSTHAQARIVDDLLDVARIVTGKMKIEPRPMLLRPLLLEALESVNAAAGARSIEIRLDLDDPPIPVLGDPDRLRQVIWNLLANAIKFTQPGGHVFVRLERGLDECRLTVRDDGPGISPELLPVIFERFRQGDSSSSRAAAGLGLGLSIVKHLIELHGGRATAESEGEGKGASFTISIPLAPREAVEAQPATAQPPKALEGRSLLVVDDEQDTCLMIASMLRQFGADVRTASSTAEALSLLRASRPHLVLSDLAMPGLDGFELAAHVRAELDSELPLLAVTAYGRPEDREKAMAAGFTAYLRKPLDPETLVEAIRRLLDAE